MTVGLSGDLSNLLQDVQTAVSSAGASNASASDTNTSAQNSVSSASQTSEDCAIDTRFLAGCDLTEYTAKIEEGLKGENKAFFERLKIAALKQPLQPMILTATADCPARRL